MYRNKKNLLPKKIHKFSKIVLINSLLMLKLEKKKKKPSS